MPDDLQKPRLARRADGASQILRVEGEARPAAGRVEVTMSSSPYQHRQARQRQLELAAKAHHLRHHPTLTEQRLWAELRSGRLGVTFRRQVVIGRFIADFACTHPRLVVEVDGGVHADRARLDVQRDAHLRRAGYQVLRIPAALVISNLPAAVSRVREALTQQ